MVESDAQQRLLELANQSKSFERLDEGIWDTVGDFVSGETGKRNKAKAAIAAEKARIVDSLKQLWYRYIEAAKLKGTLQDLKDFLIKKTPITPEEIAQIFKKGSRFAYAESAITEAPGNIFTANTDSTAAKPAVNNKNAPLNRKQLNGWLDAVASFAIAHDLASRTTGNGTRNPNISATAKTVRQPAGTKVPGTATAKKPEAKPGGTVSKTEMLRTIKSNWAEVSTPDSPDLDQTILALKTFAQNYDFNEMFSQENAKHIRQFALIGYAFLESEK